MKAFNRKHKPKHKHPKKKYRKLIDVDEIRISEYIPNGFITFDSYIENISIAFLNKNTFNILKNNLNHHLITNNIYNMKEEKYNV